MKQLSTAGLVLVLVASIAHSSPGQSLSAQQIRDGSISVYANCTSYVDEGEVKTIFAGANGRRTVIKPFTTAFVRPSDFRFEYRELRGQQEWIRYIIWGDGELVKTWWTIKPRVERFPNLEMALAAAAGVSSLSSITIPTLLMPELRTGNLIKSLSELKLMGEEEVNGSNAYILEGMNSRKRPLTLWVDKQSLLIVKTFQKVSFDKFETETTTTYKPQVNVGANGKLAFNAPGAGK